MYLILCVIGIVLLTIAPVACWFFSERTWLWLGLLIAGEAVAWFGYSRYCLRPCTDKKRRNGLWTILRRRLKSRIKK